MKEKIIAELKNLGISVTNDCIKRSDISAALKGLKTTTAAQNLSLSADEAEVLKALLDYFSDAKHFVAAMDKADLNIDDDRQAYESILKKLY